MKRGDVVTVAAAGHYGKPRPAVIVQTDAFPETHASVVICQMTSKLDFIQSGCVTNHISQALEYRARDFYGLSAGL